MIAVCICFNFRDERCVPFKGGAISGWDKELFNNSEEAHFGKALRQFDYSTISDVIMHLRYTAEEKKGTFKNGVLDNLRTYFALETGSPSFKIFDLKHDFPSEWHRFLHPDNPDDGNVLGLKLTCNHFPYRDQMQMHGLKVNSITVLARSGIIGELSFNLNFSSAEASASIPVAFSPPPSEYGDLYFAEIETNDLVIDFTWEINWRLGNASDDLLAEKEIEDLYLILNYAWV